MKKLGNLTCALILCPYILTAQTYVWNGLNSNCDLLTSTNWSPNVSLGSSDIAQFNSTVSNICLSPTSANGFSVSTFDFTNSASDFSFTINTNTTPLTFNGSGSITGTNVNPAITLNNTNTSNTLPNQLVFNNGSSNSTGGGVLTLNNVGSLSSGSSGNSGYLNEYQLYAPNTLTIPDGASIVMVNSGTNNSTGTGNQIGVNAGQLYAVGSATIGNNVSINLSSVGYDNSLNGGGNNIGNSEYQLYIQNGPITVGDNVTINLSNAGHFAAGGGNSSAFEQIAYSGDSQFYTEAFVTAGNNFTLNVSNFGEDHSTGLGSNYVGAVESEAIYFEGGAMFGANAVISHNNQGVTTGNYSNNGSYVGYVYYPIYFDGPLTAGNNFSISSSNSGTDSSQGHGSNDVGYIDDYQLYLDGPVQVGDNATFTATNTGTSTNNRTIGSEVGYVDDGQISFEYPFQAGNNFTLIATNYGEDHSNGGSDVGYVGDYAVYFSYGATFGSNATLTHTNTGIASGTYTNTDGAVGYVLSQFYFDDPLIAEDHFSLTATNTGTDSTSGSITSYVGILDDEPQFYVASTVQLGNDATFTLSNSGTCTGSSPNGVGAVYEDQWYVTDSFMAGSGLNISVSNEGVSSNPSASVGYVDGTQFYQNGSFSAGENLTLSVTNSGTGVGQVGYVNGSQILFGNTCTINDGTLIYASNTGVGHINAPQIVFSQGFDLTGTATIEAYNEGTVAGGVGISVAAGTGGDANIILNNNQLNISSGASSFTIGSLTGNTNSSVVSTPALIIATDVGVTGSFAGNISSIGSAGTLLKTGLGTQILSGVNTFTGTTTVGEGTLVLDGSLAGALVVDAAGTLKGTGSVGGLVTNYGLISPGNSIGTIHFNSGFDNLGGGYLVEVTGAPASDLIDVTGIADIDGGLVTVATADGTYAFRHKYTILSATTSVVGSYTDAIALNPLVIATLSQDPNNIYLYLTTDISAAATTCNQQVVANALDSITDYTTELNDLINALIDLPFSGVRIALDDLSGYQHTADLFTTLAINRQFIRRLYDPVRNIVTDPCSPEWTCTTFTPWIEGGGIFTDFDSRRNNHHGFHTTGYEVTAGVHTTFNSDWTLGVAGSYEHDSLRFSKGRGCGDSNTWFAGLYGLYRPSCYYGLFDFAYGHSSNTLERHFSVGDLFYKARSKPEVSEFTFYGEAGIDFMVTNVLIQPFVGFEAGAFWREHVREGAAGGVALDIKGHNQAVGTSRLGLHLTSHNYGLDVSFDVAWNYRYTNSQHLLNEQFGEFGPTFSLCNGYEIDRNSVDYALTLATTIDCNWNAYIEGSGESWSHSQTYSVLAGVQYTW